jgi:hypothetical protein
MIFVYFCFVYFVVVYYNNFNKFMNDKSSSVR